eukprot:scaffold2389_cov262-Pinguiococcus_pyrenoidosus.AAC.11
MRPRRGTNQLDSTPNRPDPTWISLCRVTGVLDRVRAIHTRSGRRSRRPPLVLCARPGSACPGGPPTFSGASQSCETLSTEGF